MKHVRSIGFLPLRGHAYIHAATGSKSHLCAYALMFAKGKFQRESHSCALEYFLP